MTQYITTAITVARRDYKTKWRSIFNVHSDTHISKLILLHRTVNEGKD